jgi:hypothetical protein
VLEDFYRTGKKNPTASAGIEPANSRNELSMKGKDVGGEISTVFLQHYDKVEFGFVTTSIR